MSQQRQTNRRSFLQGKSAAQALADAADRLAAPAAALPEPVEEAYALCYSRRAMACQFEIYCGGQRNQQAGLAALAALDLVDQLEAQLSIYRESSEISQINRSAALEPVTVEPRLFALLEQAVELSRQTDGAFDITTGPLARVWGFVTRTGAMPGADVVAAARELVGSRHLALDPARRTLRFTLPGVEINLGSIGKGYALDRCAETMSEFGVGDFLLHGGNSSVLARGSAVDAGERPLWTVGLRDPYRPERRVGKIHLRDRALATSGSGTQFFLHEGRRYGHILDPRTAWPAAGVLSATAIAPSAAEADALATAFYVLGPDRTAQYCAEHPQVGCVLLCPGARHATAEIHTHGLSADEFETL
jgi:FAD:protein FMN transferase